jgi:hypothetical protein
MVGKGYFVVYIDGVKKTYKSLQKLEEVFPNIWEGSDVTTSFNDSAQTAYLLMGGDPIYDLKYSEFEPDFWRMLKLNELPEKGIKIWGDFYEYWKERLIDEV